MTNRPLDQGDPRPQRRLLRARTVLLAIAFCSAALALFVGKKVHDRHRAIAAIVSVPRNISQPNVEYAHDFVSSRRPLSVQWFRRWIGKYLLLEPVGVSWDGAAASDDDLAKLLAFPDLKRLDLEYTALTDEGLRTIAKFTQLERLDLQQTQVTDDGLRHIAELRQLSQLVLGGEALSDQCLVHLRRLDNLQYLALRDAQISGEGFENLIGLTNLTSMDLQYSSITDRGLPHLARLTRLTKLSLIGTQVTPGGIRELQAALPQCEIVHEP